MNKLKYFLMISIAFIIFLFVLNFSYGIIDRDFLTGFSVLDNSEIKFHAQETSREEVLRFFDRIKKESENETGDRFKENDPSENLEAGVYKVVPIIPVFEEMTEENKETYIEAANYTFSIFFRDGVEILRNALRDYSVQFVAEGEKVYLTSIYNPNDAIYPVLDQQGDVIAPGIYKWWEGHDTYSFMNSFASDPNTIPIVIVLEMDEGSVKKTGGFTDRVYGFIVMTIKPSTCGTARTFAHEVGHSLGLDHASNPGNLMVKDPFCGIDYTDHQAGDVVSHFKTPELIFEDIGRYTQEGPEGICWNNVLDEDEECEKNFIAIDQRTCVDVSVDPPNARDPKSSKVGVCEKNPQSPMACKCIKITGGNRDPWDTGKPKCGNGLPDLGEECDDGNRENCDGCTASCKLEDCTNTQQCLGWECSSAVPCTGAGIFCNSETCTCDKRCSRDSQCPQGELCIGGYCRPEGESDCDKDEDCSICPVGSAACIMHECSCCGDGEVTGGENCEGEGTECDFSKDPETGFIFKGECDDCVCLPGNVRWPGGDLFSS